MRNHNGGDYDVAPILWGAISKHACAKVIHSKGV